MILSRYILKNHFFPFIFSAASLMGIFLLQFLMKTADRLVGKGLDTWVIIQLVSYNLAWMVVLVVPMAVLISTLMAFGGMSQNNEVTIMKATGVSLYRMLTGPVLAGCVLCAGLVYFNNNVLPDANHKAKELMFDISQKKPTLSLEPGVFSQEVNGYAILARGINQETNELTGVTIYDYNNPAKINVVTAKRGKIYFSPDLTKLVMDLKNGEIHESDAGETNYYRKLLFTNHRIAMNAEQFSFQQSTVGSQRGDRELSAADMQRRVDSLGAIKTSYQAMLTADVTRFFTGDSGMIGQRGRNMQGMQPAFVYSEALTRVQNARNIILSGVVRVDMMDREIDKYMVEIHKKYSIPVACIIFVLLGGPLGVMTRKGGFGMAASISLFFFLVYWAFLIGGEKLADRDLVSPFWGMWAVNFIMGIVGMLVTLKTARETVTLEFNFLRRFTPKAWRQQEEAAQQ